MTANHERSARAGSIAACVIIWMLPIAAAAEPPWRVVVEAGDAARVDTPVCVSLEGLDLPLDGGVVLTEIAGDERRAMPAQVEAGVAPRLWWILAGTTHPGERRFFEIAPAGGADGGDGAAPVEVTCDAAALEIAVAGKKVLRYLHAPVTPAPAMTRLERSGFIHPLWSPAGAELTRVHPPDHLHHLGLWGTWPQVTFEGRKVDFWNLMSGSGTVRFAGFAERTAGPVFGGFKALHEHKDLSAPEGPKPALVEVRDVRVWNVPAGAPEAFLVDIAMSLSCATASPVTLEKYRYGGLGFRAAESWRDGDYLTSEGKTRQDGHATRARWCLTYGPTEKGPAGVLFLSHPQNHGHPEPMRIWDSQADIFFNFCPAQDAAWTIEPGRIDVLRYRLVVHDGKATPAEAERFFEDFAHPPVVRREQS